MRDLNRPLVLRGIPKHYHWGRSRQESIICLLYPELESDRPFAEYWLGSHPSGTSSVRGWVSEASREEILVSDLLKSSPEELLGARVRASFGDEFPFLFKLLSIAEPLSIQAHPALEHAARLHRTDPLNYPDPSHKPEVSVAISRSVLLCGIRTSRDEVLSVLRLPRAEVIERVRSLKAGTAEIPESHRAVLRELLNRFPEDDVGILLALNLKVLELEPGDAIFIPPGVLHAHLRGELIECMASSDNVIRAGLTPKHRDVEALIALLESHPPEGNPAVLIRHGEAGLSTLPVDEFSLELMDGPCEVHRRAADGPELLFALDARGTVEWSSGSLPFEPGTSILVPHALSAYQVNIARGRMARVSIPDSDSVEVLPG